MTAATAFRSDPAPRLQAAIAGEPGPDALRELVSDTRSSGLDELLATCLPDGLSGSLRLIRTKYKPDRKLSAWYEFRASNDSMYGVACTWRATPAADRPAPVAGTAISSDRQIEVRLSPADPTMPILARLADPGTVASVLAARGAGACESTSVEIVRYRPGERHVLRVRRRTDHRDVYVKVGRDGAGDHALRVRRSWAPVLGAAAGLELVEPAADESVDGATFWYAAPGDTLRARLLDASGSTPALLARVGAGLRAVHDSSPTRSGTAVDAVPTDEVRVTTRASEHIERLLPAVGSSVRRTLGRIATLLDDGPVPAPAPVHGDLKADNLVVDGPRITVLDLDRWRAADPAVDLGKLLADLRWWLGRASEPLEAALADGYGSAEPARWRRARLHAALFRLRFAARRCQIQDPAWADDVAWHVSQAADELDGALR